MLLVIADASAAKRTARVTANTDSVEAEVVRRLNEIRASQGLGTLRADSDLGDDRVALAGHDRVGAVLARLCLWHPLRRPDSPRYVRARIVGETISWLAGDSGVAASFAHRPALDGVAAAPPDADDAVLQADRRVPQGRDDVRPPRRGVHRGPGRLEPLRPPLPGRQSPGGARGRAGSRR